MPRYRVFKGEEAIALHRGRVKVDGGALALYDHLGLYEVFAAGQWTYVGRLEDDE